MAPPLMWVAIEPRSLTDQAALLAALAKLTTEDPSLLVADAEDSEHVILGGMSEQHLDLKIDALKHTCNVDFKIGALQVAYRERITKKVTVEYTHKKQTRGAGQFAKTKIAVEPIERGAGFQFENETIGGALPSEYIPSIEKGAKSALCAGILAGFPVVDIKVALIDGTYHEIDSSALAFEIAARMAVREALMNGECVLLEPIMVIEVLAPPECSCVLIDDLKRRRGTIWGEKKRDREVAIAASVPLATMLGYDSNIRSMSLGRATFAMRFERYDDVPFPDPPPFRPAIGMRA
jgi:elongation factor G